MIEKYFLDPGDYILTSHVRESSPFSADAWIERKVEKKKTVYNELICGTQTCGKVVTLLYFIYECRLSISISKF